TCWDLNPQIRGATSMWPTLDEPKRATCWNEKHQIYPAKGWPQLYDEERKLKVNILYEDGTSKSSLFTSGSIDATNRYLTVGDYISGNAGNWWGAPFSDRAIHTTTELKDTSCDPFFYPPMEGPCEANGRPTYLDQKALDVDDKDIKRYLKWDLEDNSEVDIRNQTKVKSIKMWISPKN
ncbi:unnamed protein product, partial [Meganyctiphanes norvegica]